MEIEDMKYTLLQMKRTHSLFAINHFRQADKYTVNVEEGKIGLQSLLHQSELSSYRRLLMQLLRPFTTSIMKTSNGFLLKNEVASKLCAQWAS